MSKFKVGDMVHYHSIIGGEITSQHHRIKTIQREPNNFGGDVAWITGKSGCVHLDALSHADSPKVSPEAQDLAEFDADHNARVMGHFVEDVGNVLSESVRVSQAMIQYGGGFVSRLGKALEYADAENAQRIRIAFRDYWYQYLKM